MTTISQLEERYGQLNVIRGWSHTYVRMDIKYCKDGSVDISMKSYLLEAIAEFEDLGEKITLSKPTLAATYIFNVDEKAAPLSKKLAKKFHEIVVKLLFCCCRCRCKTDFNVAISYLIMRASNSNEGDLKNLRRLIEYIYGTLGLVLKLSATSTTVIKW